MKIKIYRLYSVKITIKSDTEIKGFSYKYILARKNNVLVTVHLEYKRENLILGNEFKFIVYPIHTFQTLTMTIKPRKSMSYRSDYFHKHKPTFDIHIFNP